MKLLMNSLLLGASCHQTAVPVSLHFSHQGPPSVTTTPSAETLDQTWPTYSNRCPQGNQLKSTKVVTSLEH